MQGQISANLVRPRYCIPILYLTFSVYKNCNLLLSVRILRSDMGIHSYRLQALCFLAVAWVTDAISIPRHATLASRQLANETEYDFIIAGGGLSGLTVANRLTEDRNGML